MNMVLIILNSLIIIVPVLVNVAFVTLMERKILGLSQLRLGPNKSGFGGVLQPFSDAIKLFTKQIEKMMSGNSVLYLVSPSVAMTISLSIWLAIFTQPLLISSSFSLILFMMILSLGVYPLLMSGWASASKYALIGGIRGVAQTISYEISLALILICLMTASCTLSLEEMKLMSNKTSLMLMSLFFILMWIISMIAETNRTPFDFAEGESELVSGFNIEYSSVGFALIFMAEYSMILALSTMTISIFTGLMGFSLAGWLLTTGLAFFWMWVRATYPRYRYDLLMNLAWKSVLPQVLGLVLVVSSLVILI